MEIRCPNCNTALPITEEHIGVKGKCFQCEHKFIIEKSMILTAPIENERADQIVSSEVTATKSNKTPAFIALALFAVIGLGGYAYLSQQKKQDSATQDTEAPEQQNISEKPTITETSPVLTAKMNSSKPSGASATTNSTHSTKKQLAYHYYPVFATDTENGETPYSAYKGRRLTQSELESIKQAAKEQNPIRNIHKQIEFSDASIIPLQDAQGRYLHLNLLDNFAKKYKRKKNEYGHCHIGEFYLADAKGNLISTDRTSIINDDSIKNHYRGEPSKLFLDKNNQTAWHTALDAKFPYHFSLDFKSSLKPSYLIFVHRGGGKRYAFFNRFQYSFSDSASADSSAYISSETNPHHITTGKISQYDPPFSDAAGLISLPHYKATNGKGSKTWSFWNHQDEVYQFHIRAKDVSKPLSYELTITDTNGDKTLHTQTDFRTLKKGITQISISGTAENLANILTVDLVPIHSRQEYAKAPSSDSTHIYQPDYEKDMHPEILKKMLLITEGKYDVRTTVPQDIQSGRNGYLIITSQEKKQALTQLDAFIRHKESRGFKVKVITEKDYGGGIGRKAAENIRNWMVTNYKKENLLYALFLGNPHPEEGDTPYRKVGMHRENLAKINASGMEAFRKAHPDVTDYDGVWPTDYYYVDLDCNWDKNGNGVIADSGDFGEGGINGQPEVYVGRIPFYGLDVAHGNTADVDRVLNRIIRYENQAENLAWRHDIFYAGDTFDRTQHMKHRYLDHNGATMVRHSHSEDSPFEADLEFYKEANSIEYQNKGKYGFVYYQEHGFPYGIGSMSSNGTTKLSDKHPAVFALGGCDAASPEHPNNLCYALLRHNGVAVYGGTRSVSSCSNNRWHKHAGYYSRLHFGMSTGETLWTIRGDQAKDRKIGGTNFLINLLGDPSIVPMPHLSGDAITLSPGFDYNLSMTQGDTRLPGITYEIHNNSNTEQTYQISPSSGITLSPSSLTLPPNGYKTLTVGFDSPATLPSGENQFTLTVKSGNQIKTRNINVRVKPRTQLYVQSFDSPINFTKIEGKENPKNAQVKAVHSLGTVFNTHRAEFKTPKFADRKSFTISYFQKLTKNGNYDIFSTGNISVLIRGEKIGVWLVPHRWNIHSRPPAKIYTGPAVELNKWQRIGVIYNRPTNTLTLSVNDQSQVIPLSYEDHIGFHSNKIRMNPRNNNFALDDLKVFNFPASQKELLLIAKSHYSIPQFPVDAGKVHPEKVNLTWNNNSKTPLKVEVATDLEFSNIVFSKSAQQGTAVPKLENGKRYFWRVSHPKNAGNVAPTMVRNFTTDDTVKPMNFTVRPIRLRNAKVGVAGYNQRLIGFIADIDKDTKRKLTFKKVSGPSWLRVYPEGLLFTNYGATASDVGDNTFTVLISAPDGTSRKATFTIKVVR